MNVTIRTEGSARPGRFRAGRRRNAPLRSTQALIDIQVDVALLAFELLDLVRQILDLAAQLAIFTPYLVELQSQLRNTPDPPFQLMPPPSEPALFPENKHSSTVPELESIERPPPSTPAVLV